MSKNEQDKKKRGRPPKVKTENIKRMLADTDSEYEPEPDSPVIEKKKSGKHHYLVAKESAPQLKCSDCHNVHKSDLVNVLSSAEYEIQRLKKDNETLSQRVKFLETIDLVQLLTENARMRSSIPTSSP